MIWTRLYKATSGLDGGTLYQLQNLVNRRNISSDVEKNMNASEDFLELITTAHITAAALQIQKLQSIEELRSAFLQESDVRPSMLKNLVTAICDFIEVPVELSTKRTKSKCRPKLDCVHEYAKEALILGMIFLEFKDGIREGDGSRVLRCWKYFLLLFRGSGHTNYSLEALSLLTQYYYTLPPT